MTSGAFPNSPHFLSTSFLVLSIPILSNTANEIQAQEEINVSSRKEGSYGQWLCITHVGNYTGGDNSATTSQAQAQCYLLLVGQEPDSTTDSQLRNGGGSETCSSTPRIGSC